ncbi:response regulator [Fluviicola chungangensis]|uniref:Response regulator transcription factor n=1 Tax=Fluviicola chungangensis TaxID=2597671 RepID=A0A556MJG9_9FLAO|nr:response regulator transcription factor [Fluviicola chungangensis]TSJ40048.1 response regulator transcription factor [Fluviicola chungangensis]
MIRIAVAEDNAFLAKSIQEKLALFPGELKFKFHAFNGKLFLEKLAEDPMVDVILMDIQMPEMDGIETTRTISERYPQIKVIMLTVLDDEESIFQAILAGANGYLLKDENPRVLLQSILSIVEGGAPMSSGIALKALRLLRNPIKPDEEKFNTERPELSPREIDVLNQLSKGMDYKQIAENLIISPSTVRKHIENIYSKLQAHNKMEAVKIAQKHRIID